MAGQALAEVAPDERILYYGSRIEVLEDGSMRVTDTIRVRSLGQVIRRGIYRDFPTIYSGSFFTRVVVPFAVLRVERDGVEEPFFTEDQSNGVRLYIGAADRFLDPGIYVYTIEYTTDRQLGFFEEHDELYWNVTGTGWSFPIDRVSATVSLPRQATPETVRHEAYTGRQDARDRNYSSSISSRGEVAFATTTNLSAFEGLTIVVSFPKG